MSDRYRVLLSLAQSADDRQATASAVALWKAIARGHVPADVVAEWSAVVARRVVAQLITGGALRGEGADTAERQARALGVLGLKGQLPKYTDLTEFVRSSEGQTAAQIADLADLFCDDPALQSMSAEQIKRAIEHIRSKP